MILIQWLACLDSLSELEIDTPIFGTWPWLKETMMEEGGVVSCIFQLSLQSRAVGTSKVCPYPPNLLCSLGKINKRWMHLYGSRSQSMAAFYTRCPKTCYPGANQWQPSTGPRVWYPAANQWQPSTGPRVWYPAANQWQPSTGPRVWYPVANQWQPSTGPRVWYPAANQWQPFMEIWIQPDELSLLLVQYRFGHQLSWHYFFTNFEWFLSSPKNLMSPSLGYFICTAFFC